MAVFVGGATIDAVEGVCGTDATVLLSLVEKSLVQRQDRSDPRFSMLSTIRDFAHEKLSEAREGDHLQDRHSKWYAAWVRDITVARERGDDRPYLDALDDEIDNVRSAVTWARDHRDAGTLEALAFGYINFWHARGRYSEGRAWLGWLDDLIPATSPSRLKLLDGVSSLAYREGRFEIASRTAQVALELLGTTAPDDDAVVIARTNAAQALSALGHHEEARAHFDAIVGIVERIGDPHRRAMAYINRGYVEVIAGRAAAAIPWLDRALEYSTLHDRRNQMSVARLDLAIAHMLTGREDEAARHANDALSGVSTPEVRIVAPLCVAIAAAHRGDRVTARELIAASDLERDRVGYELDPAERSIREMADEAVGASAPD
jgi:tetratricopeptide (TPR) repeat protein